MEFNPNKPIYLQIADSLYEKVINGLWPEQERIPSVRELGVTLGVNPNTIVRVYDYLQNQNIIYNKRGIGYFVSENAKEQILKAQRKEFMNEEAPLFIRKMKILGIEFKELEQLFNNQK
jgi:GntR family transcriptional regulator